MHTKTLKSPGQLLANLNQQKRFLTSGDIKDQIGLKRQEIKLINDALETKKDERKKRLFFTSVGFFGGTSTGVNAMQAGTDLINRSLMGTNDVFSLLSYAGGAASTLAGFALLSGGLLFPRVESSPIVKNNSEIRLLKQELNQEIEKFVELQEKLKNH